MQTYILRRLLLMIPVLLGVTLLTFILTNVLPGDPAREAAGRYATKEQVEAVRKRLGLDQPLPVQYVRYLGRLVQGDLGDSLTTKQSISKELSIYFPATLELTFMAMVMIIFIGIPIGVITGSGRSPLLNNIIMLFALIGVGIPVFWAGLVGQMFFFGQLHWLPLSGRLSSEILPPPPITRMYLFDSIIAGQWNVFWDALKHMIMPAFTLAIGSIASIARITHSSMAAVMRKEYIRTARAKGLPESVVLTKHALRNALLPTVTMLGMQTGWLLGGAVLVENIFSWGGLGTYAWVGIFRLDIPVIMGLTLLITLVFMILNLLTDISYALLNPRISYE
jgi:ABC-type dipeptide/oligopeptide/nickel transport system permease component